MSNSDDIQNGHSDEPTSNLLANRSQQDDENNTGAQTVTDENYRLDPDKKKLLINLCICMIASQTTRQNVIALLPTYVSGIKFPCPCCLPSLPDAKCEIQTDYAKELCLANNNTIPKDNQFDFCFSSTTVGILLCSYQVGFIFTAPFIGKYLPKIGRKNAVIQGLICMILSSACYSLAAGMQTQGAFYAISYVSRLVQGIADAQICVALFSITTNQFKVQPGKYMGFMQGSLGLGMLLGPTISAGVYPWADYWGTFLFYSIAIAIFGLGAAIMLPARLNKDGRAAVIANIEQQDNSARDQAAEESGMNEKTKEAEDAAVQEVVPYKYFFANKRCAISIFSLIYAQVCMNYIMPNLAIVEVQYGMSMAASGLGLALVALVAGIGAILWGKKVQKWDMRYITAFGLLMETVAIFMIGPAHPLPQEGGAALAFLIPGLALLGVGVSAVQVTTLRTLVQFVSADVIKMRRAEGITLTEANLSSVGDKASALFNICLALGNIIAPLLGGALMDAVGFNTSADIMSGCLLALFVFYVLVMIVFMKNSEEKEDQEESILPNGKVVPTGQVQTAKDGERTMTGKDYANMKLNIKPQGNYRTASTASLSHA